MTPPLLPASAAPFAPRASSVSVVVGSKVEPWLTQTLKRIRQEEQRRQKRVKKRLLNNVLQHQRYLTEIISSPNAIWTLASIMLPKTPETDFKRDANNPLEHIMGYEIIHIEAYVVYIDMVLREEVAYKLTKDTIDALAKHHKKVYRVKVDNACDWSDREQWCKNLHEHFVEKINKLVFRTHISALEGLEEDGTGELVNGKSEEVKTEILSLIKHPPPRVGDVTQQTSVFLMDDAWPQLGIPSSQPPVELRGVPPSSFSVASPTGTDNCFVWVPTPAFPQSQLAVDLPYNWLQKAALISALPLSSVPAAPYYSIGMAMSRMGDSYSFCSGQCQECAAMYVPTIPRGESLSSVVV
ncbi:hypothetical protein NCS52_01582900 [Fusarium sp. LHS14.1]|nr:hypothetical protein NCS52_01588400 [Fusarium sp. LHS14.1]KAI8710308.1 hypothetical protein NCS52_01582900 [Fusarium sp. LHS14.1]